VGIALREKVPPDPWPSLGTMKVPTDITTSIHTGGVNMTSKLPREWLERMTDEEIGSHVRRLYASVEDEAKPVKLILELPAQP
jgi:hypothetical protein